MEHVIKAKTSALVRTYTKAAQSESTRRSYAQDIRHFKTWGGRVPATAETVAEFIAAHAQSLKVATLEHRLAAIHRAHEDRKLSSPVKSALVKQTMEGIRRTFGTAPRRVHALLKDDLLEVLVNVAQQKPLRAARDKALLLLGWAAALRRSELVALAVEDINWYVQGAELTIRKSKTDQRSEGHTVFVPTATAEGRCPVRALERWLELSEISTGPIFRQVSRHDHLVGTAALTPQAVALVVQAAVRSAKGEDAARLVAGHSLRAGYATTAVEMGVPPTEIMRTTRHKSVSVLLNVYVRPTESRKTRSLL